MEGSTTTQVNARSQPSTAGAALGEIPPFTKVQIVGRESFGAWYQILFPAAPDGKGWVAAKYVQVDAGAEIPIIEAGTGSGGSLSGLVLRGINVRSQPDSESSSLGVLVPDDVVSILAKDSKGAWLQIEYGNGTGWVFLEYVQVNRIEAVPIFANEAQPAPSDNPAPPVQSSLQDADTMETPLASVTLSSAGAHTFQFSGNVSANADTEDWVQFNSDSRSLKVSLQCTGGVKSALWKNGMIVKEFSCAEQQAFLLDSPGTFLMELQTAGSDGPGTSEYILKVEAVY